MVRDLKPTNAADSPPSERIIARDPLLWAAMAAWFGMFSWLSLARYNGYNAGMLDLGNIYQAIGSVWRGQPLVLTSASGNVSRLAGHVELIYYAFVPLIGLWNDPRALVISQALLAASGALPAYSLARRSLGSLAAARAVGLIYLLYPVMQTAVLFDFHGDTLAMPLLLWAADALDRRASRATAIWLALALLCKVYVALPVAIIGGLTFARGRRHAGAIITLAALSYGLVAFFIIRPRFAQIGAAPPIANNYVGHYFGALDEIGVSLLPRLVNAAIVLAPTLLVSWRGWRQLLPAAPIAIAALISTGPGGVYDYRYHHYAIVVPFVVLATIEGASLSRAADARGGQPRRWRNNLLFTGLTVGLIGALLVDTPLNPLFWAGLPDHGLDPSVYGVTPRDRVKDAFLAEQVPPQAPIAASMFLGAHLANRSTMYVLRYGDDPGGQRLPTILPQIDYAVADALFDWRTIVDAGIAGGRNIAGGLEYEASEIAELLRSPDFALTAQRDGILIFRRGAAPGAALRQEIAPADRAELPAHPADFGPLRLLGARIEPLGGRRYRASYEWQLTGATPATRLVAVSRLDGVPDLRFVHLPSYVLLSTDQWRPGQIIREQFELELPADLAPGSYRWRTGWYDPTNSDSYATDARSRLAGSEEVEIAQLVVGP
jgi:uncharacterized membrane protein